ncbi:hypothetical protein HanPI659440_Chr04g0155051 [Helianthus annuus]|nr:hypothetical protein HanPI659440_Chr04g0155051 [Helianthus annuus]
MESFHRRVMLPEVTSRKEYRPDRRTFPTVKFWFGRIVSVGFSNELHTMEFVEFWRIRLPESLRSAIVTPRSAVLDCQTTAPEEPLVN